MKAYGFSRFRNDATTPVVIDDGDEPEIPIVENPIIHEQPNADEPQHPLVENPIVEHPVILNPKIEIPKGTHFFLIIHY